LRVLRGTGYGAQQQQGITSREWLHGLIRAAENGQGARAAAGARATGMPEDDRNGSAGTNRGALALPEGES